MISTIFWGMFPRPSWLARERDRDGDDGDQSVELINPGPVRWAEAPPIDAIVLHGTFGVGVWAMQNSVIGPSRGVVATATNHARSGTKGWTWAIGLNAHTTARGKPVLPETLNW